MGDLHQPAVTGNLLRQPQQLRVNAVVDPQGAEFHHAIGKVPDQRGEPAKDREGHLGVAAQHLLECRRAHGEHRALFQGDHIGAARLAVDGGQMAEHFAGAHVAEGDFSSAAGENGGADPATDDEVHVVAQVLIADDVVVWRIAIGVAVARDGGARAFVQGSEDVDAEQGIGRRFDHARHPSFPPALTPESGNRQHSALGRCCPRRDCSGACSRP